MAEYQISLLAACITIVLYCLSASLRSARRGCTGRALTYLLIASVPFLVAAVSADNEQAEVRKLRSSSGWCGSVQKCPEAKAPGH